ncbi:hypothetical protein MY10362_006090 [Beauveria mimosiformis]
MADRAGEDGAVNDLTPEEVSRIIHSHRKEPPAGRAVSANNALAATTSRKRRHSEPEEQEPDSSRKSDRQESWPRAIGALDEAEPVGDRYVGQNSIPALLREQSTSSDKNDSVNIRRDMRSILGLDNSAPFPLMSQHHLHRIAEDISTELPSDREVMK